MRARLILFALSAFVVFGQDASLLRVFQLHHVETAQDLNELTVVIRTISEIRDASVDTVQKSISLSGTASQIAIAEWLFTELDRQTLPDSVTQEFKVPSSADDVVRVFYLRNTATVQEFQEVATTIRTIAEIRRVITYNSPRALAVRGTADQIAVAAFLIRELEQPSDVKRTDSPEYRMIDPGNHGETEVRVFYLPYASTVQQFQEAATLVRTIGEIRRVFTYNARKAMVVRGTADQLALASWLVKELGKPVTAESLASQTYQYGNDRNGENLVRVFYVKGVPTVLAFQQLATQIRTTVQIRRVFTYNASLALALRGTAAQLALAEQMLNDRQVASK